MTEIQGKSNLVRRSSATFELARVRVIGNRTYFIPLRMSCDQLFICILTTSFKIYYDDYANLVYAKSSTLHAFLAITATYT